MNIFQECEPYAFPTVCNFGCIANDFFKKETSEPLTPTMQDNISLMITNRAKLAYNFGIFYLKQQLYFNAAFS